MIQRKRGREGRAYVLAEELKHGSREEVEGVVRNLEGEVLVSHGAGLGEILHLREGGEGGREGGREGRVRRLLHKKGISEK
jgi:hypothetical protein